MFKAIQNWALAQGGWSHAIAAAFAAAVAAYAAVPPFHEFVVTVYTAMPAWAHEAVLAVIGLLAWYKNTSKKSDPDPEQEAMKDQRATTGAIVGLGLISVLMMGNLIACSAQNVAQDIVNWTPELQSAVNVIDTTGSALDPSAAIIFQSITVGFDAGSNLLVAQAKAYLANPGASTLAQLQNQVVTFQQQVNAALLGVVRIKDPASQEKAQTGISAVVVIVNTILGLVASISSKPAVAQMKARTLIKTSQVLPAIDRNGAIELLASHYGLTDAEAGGRLVRGVQYEEGIGF